MTPTSHHEEMKSLYLKPGKEASIQRMHPWIFSGAIQRADAGLEEGDLVRVLSAKGECLGIGHLGYGSIAVRLITFRDEAINEEFFFNRLRQALQLRQALGLQRTDNDTFRLVHGEGDQLPGLIIDLYGETAVMQAHSVGMHNVRHLIASALVRLMGERLRGIYYKSDTTLPYKADVEPESGYLYGDHTLSESLEYGLRFGIDWLKGQKTGFVIDQRENRHLLETYAGGRDVLNMFCYTGGFSVYALRGGARTVHSVDSSSRAIDLTEQNVKLHFPDETRHRSFATDAFRFLADMPADAYDLIILDPPAFAKHNAALHNALKGYTRLNQKAFEKIRPGGILFTFSCSQAVSKEQFRLAVFTAAAQSHRFVRILHQLHQPADHPVSIYHPEGEYLKGLVLFVE